MKHLSEQFTIFSFKHHVETHHPKEILSLDDFLKLRKEIVNKTILTGDDDENVLDEGPPAFIGPPGLEVPPGMEDTEGGKVLLIRGLSCFGLQNKQCLLILNFWFET